MMSEPVILRLHPEAARNFDVRAEELLSHVSPVPMRGRSVGGFEPEVHPRAHFTEKDIVGEIQFGLADYRGEEVARGFEKDGQTIGLVGQAFRELQRLAGRLQETSEVRPYISVRCLFDCGFQWVRKRHMGQAAESFTEFVLRESGALVKETEIWYPLFHVYIQSELTLGRVTFRTLTREMFDRWFDRIPKELPQEEQAAIEASFEQRRSNLQGCAAATIAVLAEPIRAEEIASEEAEYSIAGLRVFHRANLTPHVRSYCTINGKENFSTITTLVVREKMIQRLGEGTILKSESTWMISDAMVREFRQAGLDALSRLLSKERKSPFEEELLDAILMYSRNSLFDDPANRLIYILAGVESLLLRDKNEPIQKNLGERLAFVVGTTLDERIAIRDNVTRVYELRSGFLHHARALAGMDTLEQFMGYVWRAFVVLITDMDKFQTKRDLIEALERRKMT